MSWQQYVDQSLVGSGNVTYGSMHGHDGNVWATSAGWNLAPAEAASLVSAIKSNNNPGMITLGGKKYVCLRVDDGEALLKLGGDQGISAFMTAQCLIIGYYNSSTNAQANAGNCTKTVGQVSDYLKGMGY